MPARIFRRRLLSAAAFLLLAGLLLHAAGVLLRPPLVSFGSPWRAYLAEPENSIDVLYFGSSYAYCDFDPVEVYRNSGLTGYVTAGSEQTMALTYWYLCQALETQSPQAIVLEPTGIFFDRYQKYTQPNVVYMPFSRYKLGAIFTAAEPELRLGLLWDLWFYHSRWKELTPFDIRYALTPTKADTRKGFTPMVGTAGEISLLQETRFPGEEQYQENLDWLLRCVSLCRARGIAVVLLFNPTYHRCTPEQYQRLEQEVAAAAPEVTFLNWTEEMDALALSPEHFYDRDHLNREGAALYAQSLARLLTEDLGLTPQEQTAENAAVWQAAVAQHNEGQY